MEVTQTLRKWGNGAGIRLPKNVVDQAHLALNQQLAINMRGRDIILTPIQMPKKPKDLQTLLANVSPENIHDEVDWGQNVGKEIW